LVFMMAEKFKFCIFHFESAMTTWLDNFYNKLTTQKQQQQNSNSKTATQTLLYLGIW
jgi:hypothetical protein